MNDKLGSASKSPDPRPESAEYGRPEKADWRKYARLTLWGVVAVYAAAFLISNSEEAQVSFVFTTVTLPLFVALLVALVLGALIGAGAVWMLGRRKSKAKAQAAAKPKK